jgi:hypothetical protein
MSSEDGPFDLHHLAPTPNPPDPTGDASAPLTLDETYYNFCANLERIIRYIYH